MTDPRFAKLAKLLIEYSCRMKRGERVLIEAIDVPDEFAVELMRAARKVGAIPIVEVRHSRVTREIIRGTDDKHAPVVRDIELARMKSVQAYIAIRGAHERQRECRHRQRANGPLLQDPAPRARIIA